MHCFSSEFLASVEMQEWSGENRILSPFRTDLLERRGSHGIWSIPLSGHEALILGRGGHGFPVVTVDSGIYGFSSLPFVIEGLTVR